MFIFILIYILFLKHCDPTTLIVLSIMSPLTMTVILVGVTYNDTLLQLWSSLIVFLCPTWIVSLTYCLLDSLWNHFLKSMVSKRVWKKEKRYWLVLPVIYSVLYKSDLLFFMLVYFVRVVTWIGDKGGRSWLDFLVNIYT